MRIPNTVLLLLALALSLSAQVQHRTPLKLGDEDVIPTGNEWIALPTIRATDGALMNFNLLSMRDRGLLQVEGENAPVLTPYVQLGEKTVPFPRLSWELLDYWIPVASTDAEGLRLTLTYCAPPGSRAAFIRMTVENRSGKPAPITLGMRASWGSLSRVTYLPVRLKGERTLGEAPWVSPGEVFSFVTYDTHFAWALIHPEAQAKTAVAPLSSSPSADVQRKVQLAPGASVEQLFILAGGVEEFSAAHNARALREMLDRSGADAILEQAAAWCRKRLRTTGRADLDTLMNRNLLFTAFYAWGKTIDTEQEVGVTSRSPLYYVSAAYWDRDAMLWSFPGLLDLDPALAREALEYALSIQLRNAGTHSRFIDGVVLEDGFQLDEAVAPIIAFGEYVRRTHDAAFAQTHRPALDLLRDRLLGRYDASVGLYSTLQDSQDEFQKLPFITYDNVLAWQALRDLSDLYAAVNSTDTSNDLRRRADMLKQAILTDCARSGAPGASGPIFASALDGAGNAVFTDIPPGSLFKLPLLGFVAEDDPVFARTYDWLHSRNYPYSYADQPYAEPGSYRLPFTTSWTVADHLLLNRGREQALKILLASPWDGGIITEGVDPTTARRDTAGRAFATAAGYVADAICKAYCADKPR